MIGKRGLSCWFSMLKNQDEKIVFVLAKWDENKCFT